MEEKVGSVRRKTSLGRRVRKEVKRNRGREKERRERVESGLS